MTLFGVVGQYFGDISNEYLTKTAVLLPKSTSNSYTVPMSELPRKLGNNLILRWGTPSDIEELAQFNINVHSDNPQHPETWLANWTRDLMNGRHPTTSASDFTVVVDENDGGKIVSSMNLISQTWCYAGIEFKVGRPELVGTFDNYRRKGLVRAQFDAIHAKSSARGEMVQAITGIPWYYRQFGYEMALNLSGSRSYFWHRTGNSPDTINTPYQLRPATPEDVPLLTELYQAHCQYDLVHRVRDEALWRYELFKTSTNTPYNRQVEMIETAVSQEVIGYVEAKQWGQRFVVREFGVKAGVSWRPALFAALKAFKEKATVLNEERQAAPISYVAFNLGQSHPVYSALGNQLESVTPSYAWYIRVPQLSEFLMHIASVFEERLAKSVLAGHSGRHKVMLFHDTIQLVFENGRLKSTAPYKAKDLMDADAYFPDLTFLQLLFGRNTHQELKSAVADSYINRGETAVLFDILFPKQHSNVIGLG